MDWISVIAGRLLTDPDDVARAQTLALAIEEGDAASYLELCRLVGEAVGLADLLPALAESPASTGTAHLGHVVAHAFAAVSESFAAQPDAVEAREALSARAAAAYAAIDTDLGHDALDFAVRLVGQAAVDLSAAAANLAPLVRVETGISLPSSLIAWDLYGDSARGEEIMGRNRSGTPMVMPTALQAVGR